MNQPVPKVSEKDVRRIVKRDFPAAQIQDVHAILDEYAKENPDTSSSRVQLAILKLSSGDMQKLRVNTGIAKRDFRDVIAYAEYPGYFDSIDPSKQYSAQYKQSIIVSDWEQYQEWLNR